MPSKREPTLEEKIRAQALREMQILGQMVIRKQIGARPIDGSNGMTWRLWNLKVPQTVLDLHFTRGTIVMRGHMRTDGAWLMHALKILGISINDG